MFTEVPHDMTAQRGQDVEMACSFRGAGTPSYSLEIQWWYIRNHLEWMDRQPWTTNEVAPEEETPKDATKISVSTYECRVIDFSDKAGARHHRVRAYLQVVPESDVANSEHNSNFEAMDDTKRGVVFVDRESLGGAREHSHHQTHGHHQEHGKRPQSAAHHGGGQQHNAGRELRKRDVDTNHSHSDCSNEPSCAL
ncbi:hypothetical protein XENOCAPTIV_006000 [Xenoophorus captivus]|uniref:Ig-like domain-containing protein n=1 Tax=Xenoophorus captivus TaxID=1517983 RepID=A0ABV0RAV2_9TELE